MPTASSNAILTKKLGRSGPKDPEAGHSRDSARGDGDDMYGGRGGRGDGHGGDGYDGDRDGKGRWAKGRGKGRGKNSGWWVSSSRSSGTSRCHSTFCPCSPRSLIWFFIGLLLGLLIMGLILGLCIALGAFDFVEEVEVVCIPNSTTIDYTTLGTPVTTV
ncbi:translation initiation factor IF-2-like [Branchiostoma floridae]|uniref:Translation initiation factor IF-2-like n=1 Tax=Branchiostoma floridae TaxID=7739 RepID=A0A9J7N6N9_BRAFL|nr:translation initiation factor IF-2-like [Branchiostoma floridae]XP_035693381.1 translation initiation factor IF-2-like [Branchiostoma floridae]